MRKSIDTEKVSNPLPIDVVLAHYQVAYIKNRWTVARAKDNHVFCLCRSHAEAIDLTKTLNNDCVKDPKHHPMQ